MAWSGLAVPGAGTGIVGPLEHDVIFMLSRVLVTKVQSSPRIHGASKPPMTRQTGAVSRSSRTRLPTKTPGKSLVDVVTQDLVDAGVNGEDAVDERLPSIDEVAESHSVSRGVSRETIRGLRERASPQREMGQNVRANPQVAGPAVPCRP